MKKNQIRIMLVDDHPSVMESWRLLLGNNPRYTIVAECASGQCALQKAADYNPDIMLLDLNMKPIDGFQVLELLRDRNSGIKVIGMTANNLPRYARKLESLGARGYITKTSGIDEINEGIEKVINGEFFLCREVRLNLQSTGHSALN